jgi:hypothetical protein
VVDNGAWMFRAPFVFDDEDWAALARTRPGNCANDVTPPAGVTILSQLRFHSPWASIPKLQPHFMAQAVHALSIDRPALTAQKHMHAPIAVARGLRNLLNASLKIGLPGPERLVAIRARISQYHAACPPDPNAPFSTHHLNQLALPDRP